METRYVTQAHHFEDVTRADVEGFLLPLATELLALGEEAGVPIKMRLCDTLGLGVPYPNAALPRSVPKLMQRLREVGVPASQLEWHGHNDFHKAAVNASAAWLYGCASGTRPVKNRPDTGSRVPIM